MSQDDFLLIACTDRHDWKYCIKSAVPEGQHWSGTCYSMDAHCFGDWNCRILSLCGTRQWDRRKESSTFPTSQVPRHGRRSGVSTCPTWAFWAIYRSWLQRGESGAKTGVQVHHTFGVVCSVSGGEPKDALKCLFLHLCCLFALPARGELQSSTSSTPWDSAWWCIRLLKTEAWLQEYLGLPCRLVCSWTRAQSGVSTTFSTTVLHNFHSHSGLALNAGLSLPVA